MRVQYDALAKNLFRLWWLCIRWTATLGVMAWFIILPLTPVYGVLDRWTQAEERLKQEGVMGLPLMIGAGAESERRIDSSGEFWRTEEQRSYIVFPDSFRRLQVYTYSEAKGSEFIGVQQELFRSSLIPVLGFWGLAGGLTVWQTRRWLKKKEPSQPS